MASMAADETRLAPRQGPGEESVHRRDGVGDVPAAMAASETRRTLTCSRSHAAPVRSFYARSYMSVLLLTLSLRIVRVRWRSAAQPWQAGEIWRPHLPASNPRVEPQSIFSSGGAQFARCHRHLDRLGPPRAAGPRSLSWSWACCSRFRLSPMPARPTGVDSWSLRQQ